MFCSQCGTEYTQRVSFCCHCGNALAAPAINPPKRLARSRADKRIAGVCAGFADYLEIDVTLVRILWLALVFFAGWGIVGYLIAWIAMPVAPLTERTGKLAEVVPQPAVNR
jgi:phage shock protein C